MKNKAVKQIEGRAAVDEEYSHLVPGCISLSLSLSLSFASLLEFFVFFNFNIILFWCFGSCELRFRQTGQVNPGQVGGRKSRYLIQAQLLANRLGISSGKRVGGELLQTNNNADAAENSRQR